MNYKKTMFALAIGSVGIMGAMSASAAAVNSGEVLQITAGVNAYDSNGNFSGISSGSWFAMDTNGNGKISGTEKVAISQGTTGITIGTTTTAGASHSGLIAGGDTNAITAPWEFFGNTGSDYVTTPITGNTTNGLNMSGWTVTWNGVPYIPMGTGAWIPAAPIAGMATGPYTNGVGKFSLSLGQSYGEYGGVIGSRYTLDYLATVPLGDASGFGGVRYALHLEGCYIPNLESVCAIPEASTYAMMLAGLGLVGAMARRRKQAEI